MYAKSSVPIFRQVRLGRVQPDPYADLRVCRPGLRGKRTLSLECGG